MSIKRFFKRTYVSMVRNQEKRAAAELARYLIRDNRDFRDVSEYSLTQAILSKKVVKLDQVNGL